MSAPTPEPLPWHQAQWTTLLARRRGQRLPHALLLDGPAGVGTQRFAERLAAALVCAAPHPETGDACGRCRACGLRAAGSHPDILGLFPEEPGKAIRIDEVRALGERSVLAAEAAGTRVCLVSPADAMTQGAANALLKTLEEPVAHTVMLLVSDQANRLPATIRSRCQRLRFEVPDRETGSSWLSGQPGGEAARALLDLAGGAPLLALALAGEGLGGRLLELSDALPELAAGKLDPVELAARCRDLPLPGLLDHLGRWVTDLARLKTSDNPPMIFHGGRESRLQSLAHRIDLRRLFLFMDRLIATRRQLANNPNPELAAERLLVEFGRIWR